MTMKQAAVLVLVGLVASLVSAEQCPVSLSRSLCGTITRISSGPSFSIIMDDGKTQWFSHAVNSEEVVTSYANETVVKRPLSILRPNELRELEQYRHMNLNGAQWELKNDQLVITSLARGEFVVTSNQRSRYTMEDKVKGEFIFLNLPESVSTMKSSLMIQNHTIATIVDKSCRVHTMPHNLVPQDSATQDSTTQDSTTRDASL